MRQAVDNVRRPQVLSQNCPTMPQNRPNRRRSKCELLNISSLPLGAGPIAEHTWEVTKMMRPGQHAYAKSPTSGKARPRRPTLDAADVHPMGQAEVASRSPLSGLRKGSAEETDARNATRSNGTPTVNEAAFAYYPRLRKLREFVDSNLSQEISLEDAALIAAYESTYFCAWFHRRAGLRFKEWLTLQRVRRATELIRTNDYAMWEVARVVGFPSLRAFERAFKRHTLMSPRNFKALVRPS